MHISRDLCMLNSSPAARDCPAAVRTKQQAGDQALNSPAKLQPPKPGVQARGINRMHFQQENHSALKCSLQLACPVLDHQTVENPSLLI